MNTHFESLYPETSRFKEIEKIFNFVKEGFSCQLIGIPGAGKSNLLRLLAYNRNVRIKHIGENQKWFHFVYLDLSEIKNRSFLDMEKYLFLELADSLRDRDLLKEHEKLHQIFNQHIKLQDELVLFQGLKEAINYLSIEKELTIVFMFDKMETYVPFLTNRFFGNLKILRNLAKYRFSSVFSLTRSVEETSEPSVYTDFLEFFQGKTIYLSLFDKPSLKFRISYLEKLADKKIDKQTIDEIISLTGGHGKLTRICAETVLGTDRELRIGDGKLGNFFLEQKAVKNTLLEIWQSLTTDEQKFINLRIANCELRIDADARADTWKVTRQRPRLLQGGMNYLENVGLLKDNKITIPLLAEFVKDFSSTIKQSNNPPSLRLSYGETSETIVYDETKNEIRKGDLILSDGLTALEFRLLKFLLENPNKTIERTEIINAIWKETASTAGVTDQALDQLIFRLRKKIEDDPNNPILLQTIKGRGFRFVL